MIVCLTEVRSRTGDVVILHDEVLRALCTHHLACMSIDHTGMVWRNDGRATSGKNLRLRMVRFFEPRGRMVSDHSILKSSL